jgi:hypothetical protein
VLGRHVSLFVAIQSGEKYSDGRRARGQDLPIDRAPVEPLQRANRFTLRRSKCGFCPAFPVEPAAEINPDFPAAIDSFPDRAFAFSASFCHDAYRSSLFRPREIASCPNVMFEAGVCAAWKRVEEVIFIRDAFYRPDQPFGN